MAMDSNKKLMTMDTMVRIDGTDFENPSVY